MMIINQTQNPQHGIEKKMIQKSHRCVERRAKELSFNNNDADDFSDPLQYLAYQFIIFAPYL